MQWFVFQSEHPPQAHYLMENEIEPQHWTRREKAFLTKAWVIATKESSTKLRYGRAAELRFVGERFELKDEVTQVRIYRPLPVHYEVESYYMIAGYKHIAGEEVSMNPGNGEIVVGKGSGYSIKVGKDLSALCVVNGNIPGVDRPL